MKPLGGGGSGCSRGGHNKCRGLSPQEAWRDTLGETEAPVAGGQGMRESGKMGGMRGRLWFQEFRERKWKFKGLEARESNSVF